jgi:DNA repair photolyase
MIDEILSHCRNYPDNEYVFQTKDPARAWATFDDYNFPRNFIIGTTIETNRSMADISRAPGAGIRACAIGQFASDRQRTFITIEPILDFDPDVLAEWIIEARPAFVNIGADSKGCGLPEPPHEKVMELIGLLNKAGVTIRKKINLARLFQS